MKKHWPYLLLLIPAVALASAIKTWSSGEVIRSTDLNANFSHIHNTMVGGHGARLVNSDVSASAAIAHTKMATPALLPKAWAQVFSGTPCDGATSATCTILAGTGISSVVGAGTDGNYTVTLTTARADGAYAVLISPQLDNGLCSTSAHTTTTFTVLCRTVSTDNVDANFEILVMDDL